MARRGFFRSAAGAVAATFWADSTLDAALANTQTASKPSDLKITDLRIAPLPGRPIIRLDTNQGITGYGEVRDGASKNYALMLKAGCSGENPCNIDKVFRKIKQFGFHARQGGGVCGVEMALWDLAGKAYSVPVYPMLGGKFRDPIRSTPTHRIARSESVRRAPEERTRRVHLAQDGHRHRPARRRSRHALCPGWRRRPIPARQHGCTCSPASRSPTRASR